MDHWPSWWLWLLHPLNAAMAVAVALMVGGAIGVAQDLLALLGLWRKKPNWRK